MNPFYFITNANNDIMIYVSAIVTQTTTDTLLDYVLRFMEAQNRVSDKQITPLDALKIYHEMVRAR